MPPKSKKQKRFMEAVANNPKFAKKVGVPQSVGKEFTKVKKYEKGGQLKYATKNEKLYDKLPKEYKDMYSFGEFVTLPDFEKAVLRSNPKGREVKIPGKKEGGMLNKGRKITPEMRKKLEPGYRENYDKYRPKRYKTKDQMTDEEKKALLKPMGRKKGGKIGMGMTKNNYKKGGSVKCKRDGICVRGKTKGRMI